MNKIKRQGFILLLVLAVLASLILIVVNLVETVQLERELSSDYLQKTRSRLLARSGIEFLLASLSEVDVSTKKPVYVEDVLKLGRGTFFEYGDEAVISATDASSKINVNDGIVAGEMEAVDDRERLIPIDWYYNAAEVNPWPDSDSTLNLQDQSSGGTLQKSGLINLRVRRLLNAYGDAHRYVDQLGTSPTRGSLSSFTFTASAADDRGVSIPLPVASAQGLGDVIVSERPKRGYNSIEEIRRYVNQWASLHITAGHYTTAPNNFKTFFDFVTADLTVASYEDNNFYRLRTETAATLDSTDPDNPYNTAQSPYMWHYQNDTTDSRFHPNYLDRFPINLRDDSANGIAGTASVDNHLWAPHSVPLINLNGASLYVKSAVFYAPTNVSYLCESAVTHAAKPIEKNNSLSGVYNGWDPTRGSRMVEATKDLGMARSSIGVRGPCFDVADMQENGVTLASGGATRVQKNRLMSMTDALTLAQYYDGYNSLYDIYNFDDFKSCLTKYRQSQITAGKIAYERSKPFTDSYFSDHVKTLFANGSANPNNPGDPNFDPHRDDVTWISQYWEETTNSGDYVGGYFLDDYVERTLPHIFSCVRRIPGYLGAPMALTSTYMVVEPFAYKADPRTMPRNDVNYSDQATFETNYNSSHSPITNPSLKYLGRQPKVSVEDLVTRHTLPKICFAPGGVYDFISQGNVWAANEKLVARTTIRISMEIFQPSPVPFGPSSEP